MIHMIGNAHIDPVWFWQWTDGYQEVKATFRSALDRMRETDEFVFTCACADYYKWVEESCPEMFEEIRRRVKEGRWKIVGGMWIQPDCNMPTGESIARHLLYSQRYFKEKFGVTVKTGYNVDSFGHGFALPQLLKKAGIENYVFQRPGEHENGEIPYPLFVWEAPDGSRVNAFRLEHGYASSYTDVADRIDEDIALEREKGYPIMCFYGVGNHGGGPTVKNIKSIQNYQSTNENGGEVIFSDPDTYFDEIKKLDLDLPVWKNELQHHASGCYSATSLIKKLNRQTENALFTSEKFMSLSNRLTGNEISDQSRAFDNLMFNQFHDILCGCSIREAYDNAALQLGEAKSIAVRDQNTALQKISWAVDTVGSIPERKRSKESHFALWELDGLGTPVVVFNPHAFPVRSAVQIYGDVKYATDENDNLVPVQTVRASRTNGGDKFDSIFTAEVPAFGYRLYWVYLDEINEKIEKKENVINSSLKVSKTSLENSLVKISFDEKSGDIVSFFDKRKKQELLAAPSSVRLVDIEHVDTWAHGVFKFDKLREKFGNASFEILESGPVRARLRVTTKCLSSTLSLDFTLCDGTDEVDIKASLDMHEKFRMVKLCLPVNCKNPKSIAEISYGDIERATNGDEETCHRWVALVGDEGGIGLLNDSKYSFSADGNELRMTLANTSVFADHYGQRTRDEYCVNADIGQTEFSLALVPLDGDIKSSDIGQRAEVFNQGLVRIIETYHEGNLPTRYSGMSVDRKNISVSAVKRAEDDNGFIVRCAEQLGEQTAAVLDAPVFSRHLELKFTPYEVKTIFIPDDENLDCREVDITECKEI